MPAVGARLLLRTHTPAALLLVHLGCRDAQVVLALLQVRDLAAFLVLHELVLLVLRPRLGVPLHLGRVRVGALLGRGLLLGPRCRRLRQLLGLSRLLRRSPRAQVLLACLDLVRVRLGLGLHGLGCGCGRLLGLEFRLVRLGLGRVLGLRP
eukprot:scaffold92560_cov30-Phaeocystis_antarctica.AAC.3